MVNGIAQVINEYIEKQRPNTDPCGTPDGITKGDERVLEIRENE
jgi:hypothetical protein